MAIPADVRTYIAEEGLTERSSWRAAGRTLAVIGLYLLATAAGFLVDRWPVWLLVWLGQGFVLVGSYSAMHEAAHGMLFRERRANRLANTLWGLTLLTNGALWRAFHLEHHANTGGADDPENRYKVDVRHRSQYLLLPIGGLQFYAQLWFESLAALFNRYPDYVRRGADRSAMRRQAGALLAVTVAIAAATAMEPMLVMQLWGGAFLVTCVLLPATAINEHYGCDTEGEAFSTTRTVVSNRVFRFLVWNSNFHAGHHLAASVPFHHAPRLHEYIAPRLEHLEPSYTSFHLGVLRSCGRRAAAPSAEPAAVSGQ